MLNNTYRERMEKRIKMKKLIADFLFGGGVELIFITIFYCIIKLIYG